MDLKKILNGLEGLKAKGNLDLDIKEIEHNSKKIIKGSMFIAIKGFSSDGNDYIEDAIKNGAVAVMVEKGIDLKKYKIPEEITLIVCDNIRNALAISACNFYKDPSKRFKLVGVTGTKGKTTTTFMIKSILEKAGKKVGLVGTIANFIGDEEISVSGVTTPEALELQRLFYKMAEEGVEYVIMEVSSQGLMLDRVAGTDFDIGVFTNLSKDHISAKEHKDMDEYFGAKLKLFDMCKVAFLNADDLNCIKALKMIKTPEIITYGIDNVSNVTARDITITNSYVDFRVKIGDKNERVKTDIPGRFSVYNSLAAICVSQRLGCNSDQIKEALVDVKVPGRSELVPNSRELTIMIDYAHSPESLDNILSAVKSYTRGRVISVFGCGGDRDNNKRPLMGEISGRIADYTFITSDNPRTEKPDEIVKEIEVGMKKTKGKYEVIVDRTEAIKLAIQMANKKDIIVLAGKGHEPYQEIHGVKHPFDERIIVRDLIEELDGKTKKV